MNYLVALTQEKTRALSQYDLLDEIMMTKNFL